MPGPLHSVLALFPTTRGPPLCPLPCIMVQESGLYSAGGTREWWLEEQGLLYSLALPHHSSLQASVHLSDFTCRPKLPPITWPSSCHFCLPLHPGLSRPTPVFHSLLKIFPYHFPISSKSWGEIVEEPPALYSESYYYFFAVCVDWLLVVTGLLRIMWSVQKHLDTLPCDNILLPKCHCIWRSWCY